MNGCYVVGNGQVSNAPPLCVLDTSKPGSWSARALVQIPPNQELTVSYGDDAKRMMFGLPMPSNKRLRSEQKSNMRQQSYRKEETRRAVHRLHSDLESLRHKRNRKEEKRRALLNELRSLSSPFSFSIGRQGLRSSSSAVKRQRRGVRSEA